MGLKNKSKKYIESNLSPEVREAMGFTDSYWEQKRNKRNNRIFAALAALGISACAVTSIGMNTVANKYAEIIDENNEIVQKISTTEEYIAARKQFETLMYNEYKSGNITLEEFTSALKGYSNDALTILSYASPEQFKKLNDNAKQAKEYEKQQKNLLYAAIPIYLATGVGALTYAVYLGKKSAQLHEENDCNDDIDLEHY